MMRGGLATVIVLAAASAVAVARLRREYRPIAALLLYDLAATLIREQLAGRIVKPAKRALEAQGIDPFTAALPLDVMIAAVAEHALYLGWIAGVAALSMVVFIRRPPDDVGRPLVTCRHLDGARALALPLALVAVGWAAAVGVLIVGFEHLRGHKAQALYLPVELASILVSLGCLVQWDWRRRSPQLEQFAAGLLLALETMASVSLVRPLHMLWPLSQTAYLVLYCSLALIQGGALWWLGRSRA